MPLSAVAWLSQLSSSESAPKAASIGLTAAPGFFAPGLAKERDMPVTACVHSGVVNHMLCDTSHLAAVHILVCQTKPRQLAAAQAEMPGNSIWHGVFQTFPNSHSQGT